MVDWSRSIGGGNKLIIVDSNMSPRQNNNFSLITLILIVFCVQDCVVFVNCVRSDDNINKFIYIDGEYEFGKTYNILVNYTVEYIYYFLPSPDFYAGFPARITVSSDQSTTSTPVFVTARQKQGVLSWEVPMVINNVGLTNISRTLCPNRNLLIDVDPNNNHDPEDFPIIHIYTSSKTNVLVSLKVDHMTDFSLEFDKKTEIKVSPAKPVVYFYSFTKGISSLDGDGLVQEPFNDSLPDDYQSKKKRTLEHFTYRVLHDLKLDETRSNVLVHLTSNDDTCTLMSIQNASCPIFDTEREITYEGFYATISKQGGITVTKENYPRGFYIVLVVKSDDKDCSGQESSSQTGNNFANFFDWNIKDYENSEEFYVANKITREKSITIQIRPSVSYQDYIMGTIILTCIIVAMYLIVLVGLILYHKKSTPYTMDTVDNVQENNYTENGSTATALDIATNNYGIRSVDADSTDGQLEPLKQIYLNELCTRNMSALKRQSNMFFWHLITVAVFYGLPVVQLVITYQRVLNQTGNQDQCYYNFLCSHPLGFFSDFNHIYSNIGYILLGLLFIIIVWRRRKMHCDKDFDANFGIPQHYGLYYAMGGALIMEGVLSASYHICPNHSNFQFDTSFMYVMAVLCMIKIYQSRHPDVNARAHVTFTVLAATVFLGMIGVLFPIFWFWLFFTVVHITTCLILSLQVYYMGRVQIDMFCCKQCICGGFCRPAFRSRYVMVIIANVCNWTLAGVGLYFHSKDFASHLLYLFLMNLALYMFWYIIMKLIHGERPRWYTWLMFVLGCLAWGGALRFFFDKSTSWSMTPAQSRSFNKHCALLKFYDFHDIWHFLSAAAMFFSFMLFLTMDDDILRVPRHKIPVF